MSPQAGRQPRPLTVAVCRISGCIGLPRQERSCDSTGGIEASRGRGGRERKAGGTKHALAGAVHLAVAAEQARVVGTAAAFRRAIQARESLPARTHRIRQVSHTDTCRRSPCRQRRQGRQQQRNARHWHMPDVADEHVACDYRGFREAAPAICPATSCTKHRDLGRWRGGSAGERDSSSQKAREASG